MELVDPFGQVGVSVEIVYDRIQLDPLAPLWLAEGSRRRRRLRERRAVGRGATPVEERVQLRDDRGALADRSPHPLHRAATDVANSEDSFDTGLQR